MPFKQINFVILFFLLICLFLLSGPATAFERCDGHLPGFGSNVLDSVSRNVVYEVPANDLELAKSVEFSHEGPIDTLFPYASYDRATGKRSITIPRGFARFVCQVHQAPSDEDIFLSAQHQFNLCIDGGYTRKNCTIVFGNTIEDEAALRGYEIDDRPTTYMIAASSVIGFVMHEMAHHVLGHFDRIRSGDLNRLDAEFEADFFSILTAVQNSTNERALLTFFLQLPLYLPMGDGVNNNYEPSKCRFHNILATSIALREASQVMSIFLQNQQSKEIKIDNLNSAIVSSSDPNMMKGIVEFSNAFGECSKLSLVTLGRGRSELRKMSNTIFKYRDVLLSRSDIPGVFQEYSFSAQVDVENFFYDFRRAKVLPLLESLILSKVIQSVSQSNNIDLEMSFIDQMLGSLYFSTSSRTYGRLLNARAAILQRRSSATIIVKKAYEDSLKYDPDSVDTFLNLALINWDSALCFLAIEHLESANAVASNAAKDTIQDILTSFHEKIDSGTKDCHDRP